MNKIKTLEELKEMALITNSCLFLHGNEEAIRQSMELSEYWYAGEGYVRITRGTIEKKPVALLDGLLPYKPNKVSFLEEFLDHYLDEGFSDLIMRSGRTDVLWVLFDKKSQGKNIDYSTFSDAMLWDFLPELNIQRNVWIDIDKPNVFDKSFNFGRSKHYNIVSIKETYKIIKNNRKNSI